MADNQENVSQEDDSPLPDQKPKNHPNGALSHQFGSSHPLRVSYVAQQLASCHPHFYKNLSTKNALSV
jgi:hypothetical protein